MRNQWLLCLLVSTAAWAQTSPPATLAPDSHHSGPPATASNVAPDAPVLTIKGLCPQPTEGKDSAKSSCQTVVTRAQFEKLVDAIQPNADQATRQRIAKAYPQFLIMAREAVRRGIDSQPDFEQRLAFARLQILSQELTHQIQREAAQVPEKDITDWYQSHSKDFEQVNLERIVVPNTQQQEKASLHEPGSAGSTDAMAQEAQALRTRAAAGEDFIKLQKEAYEFAGVAGDNQPNPNLLNLRRRGLPPAHEAIFELKPGEVSPVISDGTGHYIYKMDSKEIEPLQNARPEISNLLRRQRVKELMESVQYPFTTETNSAYFGAEASAADSD